MDFWYFCRMIKLQTPVIDEKCRTGISFSDKIMMLGSCFTDNIGKQLKDFGFDVSVNPFGTLYNPVSILQSVRLLTQDSLFTDRDCVMMGAGREMICSFSHHTAAARKDKATFLADANTVLEQARRDFRQSNRLVITLGTSWCFRHMEKDMIVSNCLKRPASEFTRERLDVTRVSKVLNEIVELCRTDKAGIKKDIIFTVSPIRHFKDGAHGNQVSKAALLLGINQTTGRHECTDYFPAYEIVMDELRDYRFYAEDMCHPSQQTIDYICDRFLDWALPKEERPQLEENIRSYRRSCHRPLLAE